MNVNETVAAEAAPSTPRLFGNPVTGDQALTTQEPIGSTEASEQNDPPSESAPESTQKIVDLNKGLYTGLSGLPPGGLSAMEDDDPVEPIEEADQTSEGPSTEQIETTGEVSTQTEPAPAVEAVEAPLEPEATSSESGTLTETGTSTDGSDTPSRDLTDPSIDLSTLSVEELQEREKQIHQMIEDRKKAEKEQVLAQIIQVAGTYHVTLEDIVEAMGGLRAKRKGVKAKAKYKDPATSTTWSGRGKAPAWIKGKDYNEFLIKE